LANIKEYIFSSITRNPNWVNRLLLIANHWPEKLYGDKYIQHKTKIPNHDYEARIIAMINYAIDNVPYYQKLYNNHIENIDEFKQKVGFIDRQTVAENTSDFISLTANLSHYVEGTTGGTSGKPLQFLMPKNRHHIELAFIHNMWNRVDWHYNMRGVLRNHSLRKSMIYKINPITKEYVFDNFRLNHEYAREVYSVLKKYDIQYIHAYPSAAYQFCKLCNEQNLDLSFIKSFLCGSESVLDFQKKLIADELGINIFSWYGHSEKLVLGGYCEHTNYFHIEPEYGYFELIDQDNKSITTSGMVGEIVGTTYHNFGMPFIRYRTGDFAEYVGKECPECGRKMPIIKNIQGRWDKNLIFKKDGTYITTTSINLHNELYKFIDGFQYIQNQPGELIVRIVKNQLFEFQHEEMLLKHFSGAMGENSQVKIEYAETLQMQPNGKFELLISNYKKNV
jgi:phenylacetate-CoA ligase